MLEKKRKKKRKGKLKQTNRKKRQRYVSIGESEIDLSFLPKDAARNWRKNSANLEHSDSDISIVDDDSSTSASASGSEIYSSSPDSNTYIARKNPKSDDEHIAAARIVREYKKPGIQMTSYKFR